MKWNHRATIIIQVYQSIAECVKRWLFYRKCWLSETGTNDKHHFFGTLHPKIATLLYLSNVWNVDRSLPLPKTFLQMFTFQLKKLWMPRLLFKHCLITSKLMGCRIIRTFLVCGFPWMLCKCFRWCGLVCKPIRVCQVSIMKCLKRWF